MPEISGETTVGFEIVREAFAENLKRDDEVGAAVAVYLHGRKVVDLWGGIADPEQSRQWERDTLQVVYPTTKAVTATCALLLALAAQRPFWEPGTEHGYHGLTFGWLVGEVVRRVSGRSLETYLAADPTSLTVRSLRAVTPALDHHNPDEQRAEMPSTNGICTARARARFYAALIGEVDGHRILEPDVLAAATAQRASGIDRTLRVPVRIGTGLGLPAPDAFWYSPSAFGFPGLGGSLGFADPATGLGFGYVMNHVMEGTPELRAATLVDAVRTAMTGI